MILTERGRPVELPTRMCLKGATAKLCCRGSFKSLEEGEREEGGRCPCLARKAGGGVANESSIGKDNS